MPGFPFSINGNTYAQADFDGFAYTVSFPNLVSDVAAVAAQTAADRAAVLAAVQGSGNFSYPLAQCRLIYVSATQVRLIPYMGSWLHINGLNRAVPAGGVNLASTGLAAGTLYYVYAYLSGSTITLEASTTGFSLGTAGTYVGVPVKNGDATRTLVGMVYVEAADTFVDTAVKRHVASYFNRSSRSLAGNGVTGTTSSTTLVEISTTIRVTTLAWDTDAIDATVAGQASNNTSGQSTFSYVSVDGSAIGAWTYTTSTPGDSAQGFSARATQSVSVGLHTVSLFGRVNAGTGSWTGRVAGSVVI